MDFNLANSEIMMMFINEFICSYLTLLNQIHGDYKNVYIPCVHYKTKSTCYTFFLSEGELRILEV